MRRFLRASQLLFCAFLFVQLWWVEKTLAEEPQPTACIGISPLQGKVRPLLLRVVSPPQGPAFDQVRISIAEIDSVGARIVRSPERWKLRKKQDEIRLVGKEPTRGPLEIRIDFRRAVVPKGRKVDIQLLAKGKPVADFPAHPFHQFPLRKIDKLLAFPPLLTPGEELMIRPLNPCLTPLGGRWTVGQASVAEIPGEPDSLSFSLDPELDSLTPVAITYTNEEGEVLVKIDDLFAQSKARVSPQVKEEAPRWGACDAHPLQESWTCLCGWFPNRAARKNFLVDGDPAPPPVSASSRSVCFDLPPGTHHIQPSSSDLFPNIDPVSVARISIRTTLPPSLNRGQRDSYSWQIIGSDRPVDLLVRNRSPSIVHLEGGPIQVVRSSGGTPNIAQVQVVGVRPGSATVHAEMQQSTVGLTEYQSLLSQALKRDLQTVRSNFLAQVNQRQAKKRPEELLTLIDSVELEILSVTRFRELAPLRTYVQATFEEEIRPQAEALTRRTASLSSSPFRTTAPPLPLPTLFTALSFANVETTTASSVIDRILQLLKTLTETVDPLVQDLVVIIHPKELVARLHPKAFPGEFQCTASTRTLKGLYFGRYEYELYSGKNQSRLCARGSTVGSGEIDLLHQEPGALCLTPQSQGFFAPELGERCP